jgi:hypothetical protein
MAGLDPAIHESQRPGAIPAFAFGFAAFIVSAQPILASPKGFRHAHDLSL